MIFFLFHCNSSSLLFDLVQDKSNSVKSKMFLYTNLTSLTTEKEDEEIEKQTLLSSLDLAGYVNYKIETVEDFDVSF